VIENFRKFVKFDTWNEENIFIYTIIGLAMILGSIVRIHFIAGSLYPVNDGGLFFQMTEDLLGNQLILPKYSTYNQVQIPFAYPPLAFYITALIHKIFNIPVMDLFRILPCVITILTLPAYYYLAKEILSDKFLAALSLYFFAMVPRAFEWFVMGGGITRSIGFLFAILALRSIWRLFKGTPTWIDRTTTILFSSLTVLAHPETALFVIFAALIFYIYQKPNRPKTISGIIVGLGVMLITLPWTVSVYLNHGLGPFLGAGGTGHDLWFEIKNLLTLNYGFENNYFLSIYGVFALIGVFSRRDRLTLLLFGLLVIGYSIFPRSGVNLLTIVISMLAAFGLIEILALLGRNGHLIYSKRNCKIVLTNLRTILFFTFVLFYVFLGAFTYKYILGKDQLRLSEDNMRSFAWIEKNTKQTDQIMFYPIDEDNRFWWNDFLAEWAPALTGRISVTTIQGSEWLPSLFDKKIDSYIKLRSCADTGPVCVRQWEDENQTRIRYLVIDKKQEFPDFVNSFIQDNLYNVVYELESMIILSKAY
jgi:hypothetical protein